MNVEKQTLTERTVIKRNNPMYKTLDHLCFLSKNLYNAALECKMQEYAKTKKNLSGYDIINKFTKENQVDYKALPAKVSQQVILQVHKEYNAFFGSLKSKKVNHGIKTPKPKDAVKGRNIVQYTKQTISKKSLKNHLLNLSGIKGLNIKCEHEYKDVVQARIVPRESFIVVEVAYEVECKPQIISNNYAGIDLGVNNLATVSFNNQSGFIINGRSLKSINQFYNKNLAKLKSEQDLHKNKDKSKRFNRNKIIKLTNKRNNKINDYMHKASRKIVNHLVSKHIATLVIGYNKGWKQKANMGKKNNQKFVGIPFLKFIQMLQYKCRLEGIKVVLIGESYTSMCSFMDGEEAKKHLVYLGKRIKRGLFRTAKGFLINADLNGSLNILKKAIPNAFMGHGIEVCSAPIVLKL